MDKLVIDLNDYIYPKDTKFLSGRPNGEKVRRDSQIDDVEDKYKCIEIIIPNNIKAINPSYFLGFLGPSVRKCITEEDFNKKFKFKISSSDSQSFVESDINDGIQRALKESGLIEL